MHSCSDESDVDKSPQRKKKVVRYEQKFVDSWLNDENFSGWLVKSKKGNTYFYCSACDCDRKCGFQELIRHKNSSKHVANCKKLQKQPKLTSLFPSTSKSQDPHQMAKAGEIKLACFIAEHNLAFNVASHLTNLIKSVCPDSKTAEYMSMSRTKARAIVVNVTGITAEENLIKNLRENEFSLLVDESTDKATIKHLALIARLVNTNYKVEDKFLTLIPITDGTAKVLYQKTIEYFNEKEIPYKRNMLGFASDSANVMFGGNNSMMTNLKNDIPNLFTMKCICHSFALCASRACEKLPRGLEDFCREVFNHIQNSPKRIGDFKTFQAFTNIKPHKILHPSQTRWLSLNDVVNRLLEQLPAIKLYFQSAVFTDRLLSAQSILTKAMEPTTELYLEFLRFALPIFTDLNKEMQTEKPKLYSLYNQVFTAYVTILECFIQPVYLELTGEEINKTKDILDAKEKKILSVDVNDERIHLPLMETYVGGMVPNLIRLKKDTQELDDDKLTNFYGKCKEFYIEALIQIKQRFPFDDKERLALKCLQMLNPEAILGHDLTQKRITSISEMLYYFPGICPENITELDREWRSLRNINLNFDKTDTPNVEEFWWNVSKLKKGDGFAMFPLLSTLTRKLLCLPHSTATVERLFSSINVMKTKLRNKLSTTTIKGTLHTKSEINNCFEFNVTNDHLKKFNKNMYEFNKNKNETENQEDLEIENNIVASDT